MATLTPLAHMAQTAHMLTNTQAVHIMQKAAAAVGENLILNAEVQRIVQNWENPDISVLRVVEVASELTSTELATWLEKGRALAARKRRR